jgi:hypothetical protein
MGDLFSKVALGKCQSVWTSPLPHEREAGAPQRRIIHSVSFRPHAPATLRRLGYQPAQGYHKCGSRQDEDWVVDLRILLHRSGEWREHALYTGLPRPTGSDPQWIDLAGVVADGAVFEIRRCGIDEWWTPWNLAAGAFILEADPVHPASQNQRLLSVRNDDGSRPSHAGSWILENDVIRLELAKTRPSSTSLSLRCEDTTGPERSLLYAPAGSTHQGIFAEPVGAPPLADQTVRCDISGTSSCKEGRVSYEYDLGGGVLRYRTEWELKPAGFQLRLRKEVPQEVALWESAAWRFTVDTRMSPSSVLGALTQAGRTGLVQLPAIMHFPRYGSFRVSSQSKEVLLRCDTERPANRNTIEIKLGEVPGEAGDFIQKAGVFEAEVSFDIVAPPLHLAAETPDSVARALRRVLPTAFTFRPDTGTLSNNGASMHCPICMDNWAGIALRMSDIGGGIPGALFLRYSLERWLDGGPGYASGALVQDGEIHPAEDEYLMTGSAALLGLSEYLGTEEGASWAPDYLPQIRAKIDEMALRDLDNDGLIESPYRTGVSGTGQWSTCWLDVLSFGWKDAFSNALLYAALRNLATALSPLATGDDPLVDTAELERLNNWAEDLAAAYYPTFYNPDTGWLAGWRCKEDRLHDYAFPQLNGAAVSTGVVSPDRGRPMLQALLREMDRAGMPDPILGMPGNLRFIPDEDRADIIQGFPMGYYQNGGRTHAQTRHFLDGLYVVGLRAEADRLLERLCEGLAEGYTYGGNQSGVDWRYWDDRPCGYEGLLTDQFGLLGTALARYGGATADNS